MTRIILILLILSYTCTSHAQHTEQAKENHHPYHIKLYNLVSVSPTYPKANRGNTSYTEISSYRIWNPSLAAGYTNKKGNTHEFELTNIGINAQDNRSTVYYSNQNITAVTTGNKIYETNIVLRYEYILNLLKKSNSRVHPSLGFAASPYYTRYNLIPYVTSTFPTKDTYIGMRAFIVPRVSYDITKRLFIDLNIPLCLTDFNYNIYKERNPTKSMSEQEISTANFSMLPAYFSARLGVGLKI